MLLYNIKILSLKQLNDCINISLKTRKKFQIVSQTISGSLRHHPLERGQGETGHQSAKRIKITKK
jgi:hypothetical protein